MSQSNPSLLSLSIAAASAAPIPEHVARSSQGTATSTKHRRLSSAGRSRRRLSDARDAATRHFPTSLQTTSVSLAALSLSSPTVSHRTIHSAQPIQVPRTRSARAAKREPADVDDAHLSVSPPQSPAPNSVNVAKSGRKRGTIFTCESCSKVYRHPSCLIKHRWEHTPQWREASKFVLSKHQQVQLLEAAAILSHLSPSSASLPEDRSLWPSFLSGGLVPPPAPVPNNDIPSTTTATSTTSTASSSFPISSSVPATTVLGSHDGPRLHDYAIGEESNITHVRPGMLVVPTSPTQLAKGGGSSPVPVPMPASETAEDDALNLLALRSGSASVTSHPHSHSHSRSHAHARSYSYSHARSHSRSHVSSRVRRRSNAYEYGMGAGAGYETRQRGHAYTPHSNGVSIPRSSLRSYTGSSRSRSQSLSVSVSVSEGRSDDEDEGVFGFEEGVDEDVEDMNGVEGEINGKTRRTRMFGSRVRAWGRSVNGEENEGADEVGRTEETWDGMEMEMEMN